MARALLLSLNLALLLPSAHCGANPTDILTWTVPYWTDDAGYCNPLPGLDPGVHRPHGLDRIHVKKGDLVSLTYSTHHDIWSHPSLDALESCDYSAAVMIANTTQGGGCEDEADLCMRKSKGPLVAELAMGQPRQGGGAGGSEDPRHV